MPDSAALKTAADVGGWVFAELCTFSGAYLIIRWLMGLLERQTTAMERLTDAVSALTDEIRASRGRR